MMSESKIWVEVPGSGNLTEVKRLNVWLPWWTRVFFVKVLGILLRYGRRIFLTVLWRTLFNKLIFLREPSSSFVSGSSCASAKVRSKVTRMQDCIVFLPPKILFCCPRFCCALCGSQSKSGIISLAPSVLYPARRCNQMQSWIISISATMDWRVTSWWDADRNILPLICQLVRIQGQSN